MNSMKIIIAGPGAGKTHRMINEILTILPEIRKKPNRICAIITYTIAATEEIKDRLAKQIVIPNNVFIGTSHSFLIKYIIRPYASLFLDIPSDKIYIDSISLSESYVKWINGKFLSKQRNSVKKNTEIKQAEKLLGNGIITYDKILELSYKLITEYKVIANKISKRISHLFVDEYQDTHIYQHLIIQEIIKRKKTSFLCVGDPLQSIFGFSYTIGQIKLPQKLKVETLANSPLLKLKEEYPNNCIYIQENHRSTKSIIGLINNYRSYIESMQVAVEQEDCDVFYINSTDRKIICETFYAKKEELGIKAEVNKIEYLHLAKEWNFWNGVKADLKIEVLDKGDHKNSSLMLEIKKCVLGCIGLNESEVFLLTKEKTKIKQKIAFRKFCIKIYKGIKSKKGNITPDQVRRFFTITFGYKFKTLNDPSDHISMESTIKNIFKAEPQRTILCQNKFYSTIHSSKGLEATCVLVCAQTKAQLFQWLNFEQVEEKTDETRLGYVAFSRARKLLCVACLEELTSEELSKLEHFQKL